jgi:hypothetical protein
VEINGKSIKKIAGEPLFPNFPITIFVNLHPKNEKKQRIE